MKLAYDGGAALFMAPRRMKESARRAVTFAVAAAAVLAVALGFGPLRRAYGEAVLRHRLATLADLASVKSHHGSRLSGAAAPRAVALRAGMDTSVPLDLGAAANSVLQSANDVDGTASNRAAGIAYYSVGSYASAVQELERVARAAPSAAAWNDLAAARLEASRREVLELVPALVSVENALAADSTFAPALYNRAAILERMSLWEHARAAWRVALVAEGDPAWHAEIGKHIDALPAPNDPSAAKRTLLTLQAGNAADVAEGVGRFPEEARRYAEGALPAAWAAAVASGDAATAEQRLNLGRAIAAAVRDRSGETLAAESIAAIDETVKRGDSRRLATLISAYSVYGKGRQTLNLHDFAGARTQLAEASRLFTSARSPMAAVARYYAASAILEQYRLDEAAAENAAIRRGEQGAHGHRALGAQLAGQVARTEGQRGHWDAARAAAQAAVDQFRLLGEKGNTGDRENVLAEIYDYLGQNERAWSHRLSAFELLSSAGNAQKLQVSIAGASRDRVRRKDWPAAIALLDLEIAHSHRTGMPSLITDALARRARARAASGDAGGADEDIALARAAALQIESLEERAQLGAIVDGAEGVVIRERDATNSVRLLTSAINQSESTSRILLPALYLERGRAHLVRRSETDALADFGTGIDRLEEQRATLSDFDFQTTAADAAEDLYVEAVRLAVRMGDVPAAYAFSERSRGKALLSRLSPKDAKAPVRAPEGTRIVEFMILPEKLVVFIVDREVRIRELDVSRAQLQSMVASFTAKTTGDSAAEDLRTSSADLYDALLRPLGDVTNGVSALVFIPGGILERVPWPMLYDREQKRYLVEDVSIATTPSATLFSANADVEPAPARRALVIGDPKFASTFTNLPVLRGAGTEARAIARYYSTTTLLLGSDATISRLRHDVTGCDVFHFGGHAISSEVSDDQSFLLLSPDESAGDSGTLYSRDIARMNLRNLSLVVLAACGTIRGSTIHVDGMPSIGRSFLAAGARNVVGTLWDVDDEESAALFARIHREIAAGTPVGNAVRSAQIHAIRDQASPRVWGSLVLMSRQPSPLPSGTRNAHP